jgi:hypothetical protein
MPGSSSFVLPILASSSPAASLTSEKPQFARLIVSPSSSDVSKAWVMWSWLRDMTSSAPLLNNCTSKFDPRSREEWSPSQRRRQRLLKGWRDVVFEHVSTRTHQLERLHLPSRWSMSDTRKDPRITLIAGQSRPETPDIESRQGRRNASAQLLDSEGAITSKVYCSWLIIYFL